MNKRFRARHNGRAAHQPGRMNKTEAEYERRLKLLLMAGEILGYEFECFKFRLAAATFYTPDFVVYGLDGTIEIHEVKGHWEDDARVKVKVFADRYPFRVLAVMKSAGGWSYEEIKTN